MRKRTTDTIHSEQLALPKTVTFCMVLGQEVPTKVLFVRVFTFAYDVRDVNSRFRLGCLKASELHFNAVCK